MTPGPHSSDVLPDEKGEGTRHMAKLTNTHQASPMSKRLNLCSHQRVCELPRSVWPTADGPPTGWSEYFSLESVDPVPDRSLQRDPHRHWEKENKS